MPTVFRKGGFRFVLYLDDHEPTHIHALKQDAEVVINLGNENTPVSVRRNKGMKKSEERRALKIAAEHQEFLLERWREFYG